MAVSRGQSNFASLGPRLTGRVAAAIWFLAAAGALALALGWAPGGAGREERAQIAEHGVRLREQIAALTDVADEAPTAKEIAAQAETVAFYNTLTGDRHAPLGDIMALIETGLTDQVRLSQLSYSVETGRLTFSVQSEGEAELPGVLRRFEAADALTSVILDRQVRLQQAGRALVQYDIVAEAK